MNTENLQVILGTVRTISLTAILLTAIVSLIKISLFLIIIKMKRSHAREVFDREGNLVSREIETGDSGSLDSLKTLGDYASTLRSLHKK